MENNAGDQIKETLGDVMPNESYIGRGKTSYSSMRKDFNEGVQ